MKELKKLEFAPLQGYTDLIYREVHQKIFGGVDSYYSPFLRLEHGEVRRKDLRDILPENNKNENMVPQIIFKDVAEFDSLVDVLIRNGYDRIDLNLGCSFPMQTKRGRGVALLSDEERFLSVMRRVEECDEIDFSIKMRLGMNSVEESMRLLPIINDSRLVQVTVHPRLGKSGYNDNVDMEAFCRFMSECSRPIVYNGDLQSVEDVERLFESFPLLSGVMIGRGLLTRPSIGAEWKSGEVMQKSELLAKVMQMHNELYDYYSNVLQGENQLLMKMKSFWEYLEPQIGHKAYKQIKKAVNVVKYERALCDLY